MATKNFAAMKTPKLMGLVLKELNKAHYFTTFDLLSVCAILPYRNLTVDEVRQHLGMEMCKQLHVEPWDMRVAGAAFAGVIVYRNYETWMAV